MRKTTTGLLALLTLAWATSLQAADPQAGKARSALCAACHGADGNSVNPVWPKLAGQHPRYLEKQLRDFRSGKRKNSNMSPMAAPLSDEDIANLAAWFSLQKRSPGAADPALVEQGARIYRGGIPERGVPACTGCHSPTGAGNPEAGYPALSGQHAEYTRIQLEAFRKEERSNDPAGIMRTIASTLKDREIRALASYVSGLH
ncbi:MAG: cytochrome c4 [Gammaproteobacteria bacterium]|nr:MAG: cytochrome c4 [Gammaproteobacteria bacterium]